MDSKSILIPFARKHQFMFYEHKLGFPGAMVPYLMDNGTIEGVILIDYEVINKEVSDFFNDQTKKGSIKKYGITPERLIESYLIHEARHCIQMDAIGKAKWIEKTQSAMDPSSSKVALYMKQPWEEDAFSVQKRYVEEKLSVHRALNIPYTESFCDFFGLK